MARLFFVLMTVLGLAAPSLAQTPPAAMPEGVPGKPAQKPAVAPEPTTLNSLFSRLAKAKDGAEGRAIARQIEQRWLRSGSDTANLLMTLVIQVETAKDNDTAIELLDHILQLQPQWAEAYNRRATVLFMMDDYDGALRDIRATLAREPRHYGALAGLGMIMQRLGNQKAAYAAFSKALDIHPQLADLVAIVERMRPDVVGREL